MSAPTMSKFKIGLIQMAKVFGKENNIMKASKMIDEAASNGAKLVALPTYFTSTAKVKNQEPIPGPTTEMLSDAAKRNEIYIVGGSIFEKLKDKAFQTSPIFDPNGDLIAIHRKIHMFDVDVPGKLYHMESELTWPGDQITTFDTPYCKVGVGICYDSKFGQYARSLVDRGCDLLVYPATYSQTTGRSHWPIVQQGTAIQETVYVAACSRPYVPIESYKAYGHSVIVGPWGDIVSMADDQEAIVYGDVDLEHLAEVRDWLPKRKHERPDVYGRLQVEEEEKEKKMGVSVN